MTQPVLGPEFIYTPVSPDMKSSRIISAEVLGFAMLYTVLFE